jgi:hypothetical protein
LDFALDPTLGSNPLIAQRYIPFALEHIKQHMLLWYTTQMGKYAKGDNKHDFGKYQDSKLVAEIDKAMALAATHVKMDSQSVFAQVVPAIQQLSQIMQQFKPQPAPMDGEAQAILQASMAETQRRAARDQADIAQKQKDNEIKVAINAENNLTTERIKAADLTVDQVRLQKEQGQTAVALNERTQRNLGD